MPNKRVILPEYRLLDSLARLVDRSVYYINGFMVIVKMSKSSEWNFLFFIQVYCIILLHTLSDGLSSWGMIQFFGVEREHNPWAREIASVFGPQSLVLYSFVSALVMFMFFSLCYITFTTMFKSRIAPLNQRDGVLHDVRIVRSLTLMVIFPFMLLSISQGIVNLVYTYLAGGWNASMTVALCYTAFALLLSYPIWVGTYYSLLSIKSEDSIGEEVSVKRIHRIGLIFARYLIKIDSLKLTTFRSKFRLTYVPLLIYLAIVFGGVMSIGVLTPFLDILPYGFRV